MRALVCDGEFVEYRFGVRTKLPQLLRYLHGTQTFHSLSTVDQPCNHSIPENLRFLCTGISRAGFPIPTVFGEC